MIIDLVCLTCSSTPAVCACVCVVCVVYVCVVCMCVVCVCVVCVCCVCVLCVCMCVKSFLSIRFPVYLLSMLK